MKNQVSKKLLMKHFLILLLSIFTFSTLLIAEGGYRGTLWGSSANAVKKSVDNLYDDLSGEMENTLIYSGTFQGFNALYKYVFHEDSLVMVAISTTLPWKLNEKDNFSRNFNLSEQTVDDLINSLQKKYSTPLYNEKIETDRFMKWIVDESDIELILQRNIQYSLLLTYSWNSYFKKSNKQKIQGYEEEL